MNYFVADSYKNYTFDETKAYEKSGKLYVDATCKCDRCTHGVYVTRVENGVPVPHPAYGGVCLKCGGSGFIKKAIRLYTEKEKAAMDRAAVRREERKAEKRQAEIDAAEAQSEENKLAWFEKNAFNKDGVTYVVTGNTYEIKNALKEKGCRFDMVLKWHSAEKFDLPADYQWVEIPFDKIMEWNAIRKEANYFESAKSYVEKAVAQVEGPSLSEYFGEVGERFYDQTAVYKSCRGFEGMYGWTNIYTFEVGNDVLVWFTTCDLPLEKGDVVLLTGTVKKFEEFRGVKTTQLSRCKVVKVGE